MNRLISGRCSFNRVCNPVYSTQRWGLLKNLADFLYFAVSTGRWIPYFSVFTSEVWCELPDAPTIWRNSIVSMLP